MKTIEESCSWTSRINIVKNGYTTKAICMFNAIRIKISIITIHQDRKVNLNVYMEAKKTLTSQSNPE
jgi:hypothetical protein